MRIATLALLLLAGCEEPNTDIDMHQRIEQLEARMAVVEHHTDQHGYTQPPEVSVWPGIPQEDMPDDE